MQVKLKKGLGSNTGSNRIHLCCHSSFGLGEAISRESSEIQNEGVGILVMKSLHKSREILAQLVNMLQLIPAVDSQTDDLTVSIRII